MGLHSHTFSEKGTNMTSQLHILKVSSIKRVTFYLHCNVTNFSEIKKNYFVFKDSIEETKDFKFWSVELGCHFCTFLRKSHLYLPCSVAYSKWVPFLTSEDFDRNAILLGMNISYTDAMFMETLIVNTLAVALIALIIVMPIL